MSGKMCTFLAGGSIVRPHLADAITSSAEVAMDVMADV
jgi:hypothetical protein